MPLPDAAHVTWINRPRRGTYSMEGLSIQPEAPDGTVRTDATVRRVALA